MATSQGRIRRFLNSFYDLPEGLPKEVYRYRVVMSNVALFSLLAHLLNIFLFSALHIYPLAIFNIWSVLMWVLVLKIHLGGGRNPVLFLAYLETIGHAAACVVVIGWEPGFQFYMLLMPMMVFLPHWSSTASKSLQTGIFTILFLGLYYYSGRVPPLRPIPPLFENIIFVNITVGIFFAGGLGIYYLNKSATQAEAALTQEKHKSEELAELLKKMFGRYLSAEVMNSLIEDPASLELGGESRRVTIMMTDLRGFTAMCERLEPAQVVLMLNTYFQVMVEIILDHGGSLNEIIGDAMLVVFGAPQEMPDRNEQAVACALEMQNAMDRVNRHIRSLGLPELEMGIGLNETEVIVGNIGSTKRSKYAVVGSGVNMTSRIESFSVGGQILISESIHRAIGPLLRIDGQEDVLPKGSETPIRIYDIGGIGEPYNLALTRRDEPPQELDQEIPIRSRLVKGKDVTNEAFESSLTALSKNGAELRLGRTVPAQTNLKMSLAEVDQSLAAKDFYGKVVLTAKSGSGTHQVRFTSVPPEVAAYFQALLRHALATTGPGQGSAG